MSCLLWANWAARKAAQIVSGSGGGSGDSNDNTIRLDAYRQQGEGAISVNDMVLAFAMNGGGTTTIETGTFIDALIADINTKKPQYVILTTITDARVSVNVLWDSGFSAEGIVVLTSAIKVSLVMALGTEGKFRITVKVAEA